jgi:hypothetical protein
MDPTYVGLREAKALLDEGVLTQEEFNNEKNELVKEREERRAAAAATSREERRVGRRCLPRTKSYRGVSQDFFVCCRRVAQDW